MAKAKKAGSASAKTKKVNLTKKSLVAHSGGATNSATISVAFFSGLGQLTATLFRNGVLINMQSISTDGDIHLSDVKSGDTIAINGVCAGTATINIDVPTDPATPKTFKKIIMTGFTIL